DIHQLGEEQIRNLLKPAHNLLDDPQFWQYNERMLAYFIFDGEAEMFQLPAPVRTPVYLISKQPFLLPLIPQLNNDGDFYLLHLDLERIQLYKGSRDKFTEVELDG